MPLPPLENRARAAASCSAAPPVKGRCIYLRATAQEQFHHCPAAGFGGISIKADEPTLRKVDLCAMIEQKGRHFDPAMAGGIS